MSKNCWHHTKRLKIRRFQQKDADSFFLLLTHPLVGNSLGAAQFLTNPHLVKRFLEQVLSKEDEFQTWLLYSIIDKADNCFIGGCGFKIEQKNLEAEIFYLFFPFYWGKGFAVEACCTLANYITRKYELQKIIALILPENNRAQKVAAKLGLSYLHMVNLNRYGKRRKVQKWELVFA